MECYGINGKTVTLAEAAKTKLFSTEKEWAGTLKMCAESIHDLHEKDFIHCDLKGDNIVINEINGKYFPVVIDFGKMKKTSEAKLKTLSSKEKEKYAKSHRHIAPEVVEGTHPPTKASDVYAFGLIISLICFYRKIESLRLIAFLCINGNPERRPTVHQIIEKFQEILK
jgi:serine/threonine protein kinase